MNVSPTRFTRLKVITGYLLLLSLLLVALFYIHREMQTLQSLDKEQVLNSDSLQTLIREKDSQMIDLFRIMNLNEEKSIPLEALSKYLKPQKLPQVRKKITVRHDSIVRPRPKKSFFKRIAEAFSPEKDSTLQIKTTIEASTDTILEEYASNDSLKAHLHSEIEKSRSRQQIMTTHKARIHRREQELTAQIDNILHDYEQEVIQRTILFNQHQQELRNESVRTIAVIAIIALLLAVLFLFIIGRDLTRSFRYRRELEIAKRRAEDLLHAREQLMLTITHDFKAPLGTIIGYAELLQPLLLEKEQQTYLYQIQDSSQHLLKLVTDLLDFHRLERHKTELHPEPFIPCQLFEQIASAFLPAVQKKGLELQTHFSSGLDQLHKGDVLRIRQLIDNLLSNALKFTEKGSIAFLAQLNGEWLTLHIRDTGCGMEKEECEKIFQAFTRLPGAQGKEGFGLGLSIVQKLTELLNGHIEVTSHKGEGSTFTLRIPLPPALEEVHENASANNRITNHQPDILPLKGMRLLLIDDDRIQLQLTKAMLIQQGAEADCCTQLQELTEHLREHSYDYLFTDVQMPALSGFDLLQLLHSSHLPYAKELPVIAVTARKDITPETFISKGFYGCLYKPFSIKEVIELLRKKDSNPASEMKKNNSTNKKPSPDFEALTMCMEEDDEAVQEIRLSFLHETEKNIRHLQQALKSGDSVTIAHIAHKQLPLFTLIKASECIPLLLSLEKEPSETCTTLIQSKTVLLIEAELQILELYQSIYFPQESTGDDTLTTRFRKNKEE